MLRVFENRKLRETYEPKREEVRGNKRKLRVVELHMYSSLNILG
jgi:hypothetical protein